MKKFFLSFLLLSFVFPLSAFADCLQTGTSEIGATGVSLASGPITKLDDNNTATAARVLGTASVNFWFTKDLGSALPVTGVSLIQVCETGGSSCTGGAGDSNFQLRYDNSPLTSGNTGTQCDSNVTVSGTETDYPFVCSATARYWGFYRNGNFTDTSIIASDFNITGTTCGGGGEEGGGGSTVFGSTTTATSTLQLIGATTMGFGIVITILFLFLIMLLYAKMFKNKPWLNS